MSLFQIQEFFDSGIPGEPERFGISFRFVCCEQDIVPGIKADSNLHPPIPALRNSRPETRHIRKSFPPRAARVTEGHLDIRGPQAAKDLLVGGEGRYH